MTDSDRPGAGCPGKWPRPLRLALDSIVTVLMNACVMARSRAAGSPSKIVGVLAECDEALWKLRLTERELEAQRRRIAEMASAKRPRFLPEDRRKLLNGDDVGVAQLVERRRSEGAADFLVPRRVKEGTRFDRFLVFVLGSLGVRNDVDLEVLVNRAVAIRVKRVRKGRRSYSNVVAISPPEREEETESGG